MPQDIYELFRREQSFLSRADVSILTTASNREVLALHRAEIADLIIAYLDAGEMSGEELCRQIREDAGLRGVSMLFICGPQESEIGRCESCNANAYVLQPVLPAVLLQEAHHLLNIAPRKICRVPVRIRLECETRGKRFIGTIENISTAGLFFRSSAVLPEGATVQCTFSIAGSRQLTIPGEVVRVLSDEPQAGYGVSFFDISTEATAAIDRVTGEEQACKMPQGSEL